MKQLIFYTYKNGRRTVEIDGKNYEAVEKQSYKIQSSSDSIPSRYDEWELTEVSK